MSEFEVVTLRNGARALREKSSGEIMHPAVGPWAEANAPIKDAAMNRRRIIRLSSAR